MRHALNFQLGLHARGPGRDSYKGVDEYAHARITARIAATRAPYAVRLALTVLAFVFCVTAASLLCFEACRAPCRAWVGVGCLRA